MNISRREFCNTLAVAGAASTLPSNIFAGTDGSDLAKPTPQQLEWQNMEIGCMICFALTTFTGVDKPRQMPDPNVYNPTKLDTDQWLEAAKAMGAKYAVFVAKHCAGFLQWQSNAWPYGCKQTSWRNGKGDVVKDFINSCEKYDIKPCLYAGHRSTAWWGVDNPGVIRWGNKKQEDYAKACEVMYTELFSNYGDIFEIWFDGECNRPEDGGPDLVPIIEKYQPKAILFGGPPKPGGVRWIGNERGVAAYPCWSTVNTLGWPCPGVPDGKFWFPGECDDPIRNHDWFWKPGREHTIYPLDSLLDMYYRSVGHNCNLLLNMNPNRDGLVPDADMKRYVELGNEIRRRFDKPIAATKGTGSTVELTLKTPSKIDHITIMEEIKDGERVRAYKLEGLVAGNKWQELCEGISIGHKRIQKIEPVEVAKVRLKITKSAATPKIRDLAVYNAG